MGFMLDIKLIRENPKVVKEAAKNKNVEVNIDRLLSIDGEVLKLKQELDELRARRNQNADGMKGAKPVKSKSSLAKNLRKRLQSWKLNLSR
jgi:seryl-tRNA synthetase